MNLTDPIESVLEKHDGVHLDSHIIHLCTWSDVVKNDLRKVLGRDDEFINTTLHTLIGGALDGNGRYHYQSHPNEPDSKEMFSANYVRTQCLLAEWLCIYRAVNVYLDATWYRDDEIDLDNFAFGTG